MKGNWCRQRKVKALFAGFFIENQKIRGGTTFSKNALTEMQARSSDLN